MRSTQISRIGQNGLSAANVRNAGCGDVSLQDAMSFGVPGVHDAPSDGRTGNGALPGPRL